MGTSFFQCDWFILAIGASCLYGGMDFMYKVSAEKGLGGVATVQVATTTVFILCCGALLWRGSLPGGLAGITVLAVANGTFFMFGSVSKIVSLEKASAAVVFPLTKLNILFIVLIGIFAFSERPSTTQYFGIACALAMLLVVARPPGSGFGKERRRAGIALAVAAGLCTSLSITVGKISAVRGVDRLAYMAVSYFLVSVATLGWNAAGDCGKLRPDGARLLVGAAAGILNFAGYYAFLTALRKGPLSIVHPIFSMSMVLPILLSAVVYKERPSRREMAGVALCIAAIVLLRFR
ncbi:MAG: DMT family transporter [Candidatus Tritonobacter lacicola]|nr:DMT family transporter [Candidatus Tritonobacter lacicola]